MIDAEKLQFNKLNGLLPVIVQDTDTRVVLMLGFMDQEALRKTIEEKKVTFYSRTRERHWTKGETSGNYLEVIAITPDCDNDTLLVSAKPRGPVCHTGSDTCFNESNTQLGLAFLETIIQDRMKNPKAGSYTTSLLNSGINKIAQKVGEEAVELVIEAKDENQDLFLNEAADLMYHYLLLLAAKGFQLKDVTRVLKERHTPREA